jgi:hypothetical protein
MPQRAEHYYSGWNIATPVPVGSLAPRVSSITWQTVKFISQSQSGIVIDPTGTGYNSVPLILRMGRGTNGASEWGPPETNSCLRGVCRASEGESGREVGLRWRILMLLGKEMTL